MSVRFDIVLAWNLKMNLRNYTTLEGKRANTPMETTPIAFG